ncbi:hypothetical protein IHE55_23365 [Streptomyces pactum]|uniref:Uncharacterized protein n=1 Tax=Streptomyces pactum TaxID=68249 RepID=A0ABS0NQX5_9ACTN|nr:hypothetical protein [Streptomyces pactum]MBH5337546.1 hypothetical protein [Streptomyces pactum]
MGGSCIGVFTRVNTRGFARAARAHACFTSTRRPRRGPGALAGPDAPTS